MKAAVLLMVVVVAAVAVPIQWLELESAKTLHKSSRLGDVYSFCNKTRDPLYIISLKLDPDPPQKGELLTINVNYDLSEKVTGGSIKVEIKYGIIPVFSDTLDLCSTITDVGMSCPLGPIMNGRNSTSVQIPSDIPGGHYTGSAVATDQNDKELMCADLDIHF